jgi:hypothetical protein
MQRSYDLFEIMPDGSPLWKGTILGYEAAIIALKKLSTETKNEVRAMHLATNSVVEMLNTNEH